MRAALGALTALLFTLGLAGQAVAQTRLDVSWPSNVGPLNPHLYTPNQMFAQAMVFDPLVRYQTDGTITPWLAERWDVSEDGLAYTFTLRDDVTFSNGEPFDAAAVVANFEAILANRERHAWLGLTDAIAGVEALDARTVELTLASPYYPVLQDLALPRPFRFIAPSQLIDRTSADGIRAPIGTGPWVLAETRLGEFDRFARNETYWGEAPALDEVNVKVIVDPNTRAIALQTGDIGLIYGADGPISPDTFARLAKSGEYTTARSAPTETLMLALNSQHGPTAELAVRQAINHAVDKAGMVESVFHGTQDPAPTLFAPSVPYADVDLVPYDFDPARAATLLDAAGWTLDHGVRERDGQPLQIELVFVGNDAVAKSLAEIVQAELMTLGILVRLIGEEESSVYARQRDGRFGMIFNRTWGAPFDPHAFVGAMRAPAHADYQAQAGLDDKPEIDALIDEILASVDEEERQALYARLLGRLHDSAVYLPLTYTNVIAVADPALGPIPFGAMSSEIPFERITPVVND
ncbi:MULTISPECIES: nickel ABC transporter substrate-binding protein [unclassified Halomonas]|uniref:nickel ABC transporter substrate-binding protein n=1 Tax=unclassified Halomonas TaxID=2609666 RepID=UPI00209CDEE9|nr:MULTISPECIES: nickel ABC transporter substrate-binding protein [unclassified Halomonas]MCP1314596.1 nickel ABC transporter substrate-binding protein [Halomonas sp. 707D7]MCP1327309.1 nickel ABC transporter substrate-binding protein [Halomonas sp. 707D4]